jgi:hypothetical protein
VPTLEIVGAAVRRYRARPAVSNPAPPSPRPLRKRIRFADADALRTQVQDAAAAVKLTDACRHVLAAVLKLTCGWSRISDDRVRIHQIIDLCVPEHRHDPKTVGRALSALHRAELVEYQPAQGRGNYATIAIHPRFAADVDELERDDSGRVVTFSGASPYSLQKNYPPTPVRPRGRESRRPNAVDVDPAEVRRVLAQAPAAFQSLPKHLRWCLGKETTRYLARGWRPEQILAILAAPLPDVVQRPLRLAKFRLSQNMIGSGPRLAPAQKAWDQAQNEARRTQNDHERQRNIDELLDVTTEPQRRNMLTALAARLRLGELPDEAAALVQAARMARREFPGQSLARAVADWLKAHLPQHMADPTPTPAPPALDGPCLSCGDLGTHRPELPIPAPVCDACWTEFGPDADLDAA